MESENYFFNTKNYIDLILKRWWLIVLIMLLGALAGLGLYAFKQPVYEARAVFAVSIDFAETADLDELQEDQAVVLIGDVIKSSQVLEKTVQAVGEKGLKITLPEFEEMKFLERSNFDWVLIVRNTNPETAAGLVNAWAEMSQNALVEAYEYVHNSSDHSDEESELGRGLLAESTAVLVSTAEIPGEPILFGRGIMVFMGALLGLFAALIGFAFSGKKLI